MLQMGNSDIGDDADVRTGNLCKPFHLAEIADTKFQHGNLMFFADIEDRKREPDLVVEVSGCFQYVIFSPSTDAIISLVLVFPTLPVTPTTFRLRLFR